MDNMKDKINDKLNTIIVFLSVALIALGYLIAEFTI